MGPTKVPKHTRPQKREPAETTDPVLLMLGVGSDLWREESGDNFVERLRCEDPPPPPAPPY